MSFRSESTKSGSVEVENALEVNAAIENWLSHDKSHNVKKKSAAEPRTAGHGLENLPWKPERGVGPGTPRWWSMTTVLIFRELIFVQKSTPGRS